MTFVVWLVWITVGLVCGVLEHQAHPTKQKRATLIVATGGALLAGLFFQYWGELVPSETPLAPVLGPAVSAIIGAACAISLRDFTSRAASRTFPKIRSGS
jgi:uncharacterized membrane protein YeaQ/YmgE (transglycosylase-associated protein family)